MSDGGVWEQGCAAAVRMCLVQWDQPWSGSGECRAAAHPGEQFLAHRSVVPTMGLWSAAGCHRAGHHQLQQRQVVTDSVSSVRCKLGRRNGTNPVGSCC